MESDPGIQWRVGRVGVVLGRDAGTESWLRVRQGHGDPEWNLTWDSNGGSAGPVRPLADTDTESWVRSRQGHGDLEWNPTREFNGGCVGPARPWADDGTENWRRARQGHRDLEWNLTQDSNGGIAGPAPKAGGVRAKGTEILNGIRPGNSMAGASGRCEPGQMLVPKIGGVRAKGTEILNGIGHGIPTAGAPGRCAVVPGRHRKLAACAPRRGAPEWRPTPGIQRRERRAGAPLGRAGTKNRRS